MLHGSLLQRPHDRQRQPDLYIDWTGRFASLALHSTHPALKNYYATGLVSGDTPISQVPLIAMDIETTGLDPERDEIVSIGIVPMTLQRIHASLSQHWIIQPQSPLNDASIALHGITHTQVAQAPSFMDVLEPLLQSIAGHVLVVHCRAIERTFVNNALNRLIHESIELPMIDTMELEARLHRNDQNALSWWQRLRGARPPEQISIRLADSRARYGLPFYKPHHALTDALATAELLQAQIAHRFDPNTPLRALWH